jgi:heme-degrading monooxygenase HmoA
MHVRVSTSTGTANIDEAVQIVKERILPAVREQRGFVTLSASGDRSTGRFTVMTVWETAADRDASEGLAEKLRSEGMETLGGEMHVERFEQVVFERGEIPPGPAAKLHIREVKMDPATVDDNLIFFKETVVPDMKAMPGFIGVRSLIDRKTGEGRVGSVWADEESLKRQLEKSAQRRAMAGERGIEFGDDYVSDILFTS